MALDGKTPIDFETLFKELDITDPAGFLDDQKRDTLFISALTAAGAERFKQVPGITSVTRIISKGAEKSVFPHTKNWNQDNYGPIYIPQKGKTVALNLETLPFYKNIITDYENKKSN